ncbi:MAG: Ig-like domain repeat protein, partial [Terracidiphilus sp.]
IVFTLMAACMAFIVPPIVAQNSIQLFSPVNVRLSQASASDQNLDLFNSNTLNLSCPAAPQAVISSAASSSPQSSSGFILVDNYLDVTVTPQGGSANSTVNVCRGGVSTPLQNCFSSAYQDPASNGQLNGVNPDTLLPNGGVAPIDISSMLIGGQQQVKIDLADQGGWVTNSTLYLNTNCTSLGVSAPATLSGNTISSTNPPASQLTQNFTFNPVTNNGISFQYDLSTAQAAGTLSIDANGVTPSVGDSAIDPGVFQPTWVPGTSFATSVCLVHDGEMLTSGAAGCKVFTLTCTIGTGSDATGVNCPASTAPNEVLQDSFDGPAFTLDDISTTVNGVPVTFHEGIGFLMASEPWAGGSCQFATGSGFENSTCPQNLLSTFSGPGNFTGKATTTHPNSTFISIAKVPEDLTTITVAGMQAGNWVKTSTPQVTLSSQPPNLSNTNLPGAASFVASPIQSITYGISAADSVPAPGAPIAMDTVLANSNGCPTPASPGSPAAATFTPDPQTLGTLADGQYLLHYFAKDCAGTEELSFAQDGTGSWSTNFYTFPINVDTMAPTVASGPTLSAAPPYFQGQAVTATFSCADTLSGVVQCGGQSFPAGTQNTGSITVPVSTATAGAQTFSVVATDAAGNQSAASTVNYTVTGVDTQIQLTLSPGTVTYPLGTNVVVTVTKINSHTPTGTVQIVENGATLAKLTLNGAGSAYYYLSGLSAGNHSLTAVYSGDKNNAAGSSAPVALKVLPVPVNLSIACWNTPYPYGANFYCNVNASSNAGEAKGVITYTYDGNAPVSMPLSGGSANIVLSKPPVGNHTVVISYPAQTNYAAAGPNTTNFVVTAAPVQIQFTPSTWYLTGGTLTLTATVQSWSAGPPNGTGQVTFTKGATVLGSAPVNAAGVASISIPATTLPNGSNTLTATYGGGTNYGTGSTSITIQAAH